MKSVDFTSPVGAVGSGSSAACSNASNNDTNPNDNGSTTPFIYNFNAGSGNVVSGVCIKSGNNMFVSTNKHSTMLGNGSYESGCYTIAGVGTQFLTVTRNLSGSNCQAISHLDIATSITPTNTPTPTATPTAIPTPTPTNTPTPTVTPTPTPDNQCTGEGCIHLDCDGGGTCEVNIGGTPTPTPTATPTITPTPTSGPTPTPTNGPTATPTPGSSNDSHNDSNTTSNNSNNTPIQSVLGATTMAKTGGFMDSVMSMMLGVGMLSLSVGSITYAKTKKS